MKTYNDFIKQNGATDINIYFALCIAEEYKKAKKQGFDLSVNIIAENGEIREINYTRHKNYNLL